MELQKEVHRVVETMGGYWPPFEMLAALTEEVGELADVLLGIEGVKGNSSKERLEEELGDVLFALACIANFYGIDLETALKKTIDKYLSRDL